MIQNSWRGLLFILCALLVILVHSQSQSLATQKSKVDFPAHLLRSSQSPNLPSSLGTLGTTPPVEIPAGSKIMALVDNECLREGKHQISSALKAAIALSKQMRKNSKLPMLSELRLQMYPIALSNDIDLDTLITQAEEDACILRVTANERIQFEKPNLEDSQLSTQAAPNDPGSYDQTHLNTIKLPQAWNTFYSRGLGIEGAVLVAVVDSGIDYTHRDLSAHMWRNSNGHFGYDFANRDTDPFDDRSHGTHVAGLIGAIANNGAGVAGVMGANIRLMAVKALDAQGSGDVASVVNAIRYAADNGAQVINMSFANAGLYPDVKVAMEYAASRGAVVVVASGNDGVNITSSNPISPAYYAAMIPGAISVGSIDTANGALSSYSNVSPTYVQILAPGTTNSSTNTGLLSTIPGSAYARKQGTSMSAPLVAGAAALAIGLTQSHGIFLTNQQVLSLILYTARQDSSFTSFAKNGAVLDLSRLARFMRYRYLIDGDGGTEWIE